MLGVKLTILSIVLTIVLILIIKIGLNSLDIKDRVCIELKTYSPKWYDILCSILGILFILDIIGFLYSVIWFLFFR